MDFDHEPGKDSSVSGERGVVLAAGLALLGAGLTALYYLVMEIVAFYKNPVANRFIGEITGKIGTARLIVDGKTFEINDGVSIGPAVFLLILLAGVGVSICGLLVSAGVKLLSPEVTRELAKMRLRLDAMAQAAARRQSGGQPG